MPKSVKTIPEGYHSVTPYLIVRGAARAIDFYEKAFGAKELFRMPQPDGRVGHAELQIGDSRASCSRTSIQRWEPAVLSPSAAPRSRFTSMSMTWTRRWQAP